MTIDIVRSPELGGRYVVVNAETGAVLDDAHGYGYRGKARAERSWRSAHQQPMHAEVGIIYDAILSGTWKVIAFQTDDEMPGETRYIVIDSVTRQVLESGNGFGFKSPRAAERKLRGMYPDIFRRAGRV